MMFHRFHKLLSATALCAVTALPALAGNWGYTPSDVAEVELLPGWRTADGTHMAALRVRLADGWKTYWRAPGDAGIPPSFDWSGSRNVAAVTYHWPVPEVFDLNGMRTIGYLNELILPIEFTPGDPDGEITLRADVNLGVCHDVCMPMDVTVKAVLSPTDNTGHAPIEAALAQRPDTAREAGVRAVHCDAEPISDGLRVHVTVGMPSLGPQEETVIEAGTAGVWVSEPESARNGGELTAVADLVPPEAKPFLLDRSALRITVLSPGKAVDIIGCTGS